ncbi:PH domain-containing protein [Nocardia sienata]|uniref:PH domain-containing protein n=1 Tax=Nocardia sienata TaxID=248552 RepID=UPI000A981737|nr:PH domain-containing protein [Nocardia sienata]
MSSPHQSVPPPESSHNPAAAEVTGGDTAPPEPKRVIRTTRLSFLGVFLLAMCVFFPIVGWPAGLFWLALIPLAVLVWIVRTQTTVSPAGLDLRSVFSSRHIDWAQLKGLSIPKRGFVRAHLDDDSEVPLPAVSYDRLRDLVDASGGRIPDPFAVPDPAPAASDTGTTDITASEDATPGTDDATPGTDDATPGTDDATPGTEAGSPAPVGASDDSVPAAAADDAARHDAGSHDTAPGPATSDDTAPGPATSDDTAPGDATSDRPTAGGSGKTRADSDDS